MEDEDITMDGVSDIGTARMWVADGRLVICSTDEIGDATDMDLLRVLDWLKNEGFIEYRPLPKLLALAEKWAAEEALKKDRTERVEKARNLLSSVDAYNSGVRFDYFRGEKPPFVVPIWTVGTDIPQEIEAELRALLPEFEIKIEKRTVF